MLETTIGTCTKCRSKKVEVAAFMDDGKEVYVCNKCLDEKYFHCDVCGEYLEYEFYDHFELDDHRTVCKLCYEEIQEDKLRESLREMTEKEIQIEILIELRRINSKCMDIQSKCGAIESNTFSTMIRV